MEDEPPPPPVDEASAPALRDVNAEPSRGPLGAYAVPEDADAMLKTFLSEINDVARDSEVVRRAFAYRLSWIYITDYLLVYLLIHREANAAH